MKTYRNFFESISQIEPKKELYYFILAKIEAKKRMSAKIRLMLFGGMAVISAVSSVPSIAFLVNEFNQSGFFKYVSLVFSDGQSLVTYWKEFSVILIEAMPAFWMATTLTLTLLFFWSVSSAFKSVEKFNYKLV